MQTGVTILAHLTLAGAVTAALLRIGVVTIIVDIELTWTTTISDRLSCLDVGITAHLMLASVPPMIATEARGGVA